jgi:hypothetical protein
MPRGRQTDILTAAKVTALSDLGYSAPQIEALTGVSARTAWGILNNEASWGEIKNTPVFKANRIKQKEALEAASRVVAAKALVQVEKKIENASAYQAAGIYGLLRTHERLDAGEPTQMTASFDIHTIVALDKLAALLSQRLIEDQKTIDATPSQDNKTTKPDR